MSKQACAIFPKIEEVDGVMRADLTRQEWIVEVHPDPDHALSDGAQSLRPRQFTELMEQLRLLAPAVGKTL